MVSRCREDRKQVGRQPSVLDMFGEAVGDLEIILDHHMGGLTLLGGKSSKWSKV